MSAGPRSPVRAERLAMACLFPFLALLSGCLVVARFLPSRPSRAAAAA